MNSDHSHCTEDGRRSEDEDRCFQEDLEPRKRRISFSSDDSEPLLKCFRCDTLSSTSDDEDRGEPDIHYFYGCSEEVEIHEEDLMVPLAHVSEAPIGAVSSISTRESSFVVEISSSSYPVDVGTRLCLADGTYAGTVVSVFGPVQDALCLVKVQTGDHFSMLVEENFLLPGKPLHYDLLHQTIIFCPELQCDTTVGSDASYVHDEELPDNVRPEFSDDEKERIWLQENKELANVSESRQNCGSEEGNAPGGMPLHS